MTSLCHPSVMVSLAESSPKYSMLKMIPVLVHNPSSGSFQVTSSPRWSLRRQSFLRSFAMFYVWRRLRWCNDHYKSKLGSEGGEHGSIFSPFTLQATAVWQGVSGTL